MTRLKVLFWTVLVTLTMAQVMFSVAYAFDVNPTALTDDQAGDTAQLVWNLIVTKQYALALGPVVALLVFALRKWDRAIPKVGPAVDTFLNQPLVAFLLPTVVSAAAGAGTALAAHKPAVDVLAAVFQASMSAVFTYVGTKKIAEQARATPPPPPAPAPAPPAPPAPPIAVVPPPAPPVPPEAP